MTAVITVRCGIGQGDLWWRKDFAHLARPIELVEGVAEGRVVDSPTTQAPANVTGLGTAVVAAPANSATNDIAEETATNGGEDNTFELPHDRLQAFLKAGLAPMLAPLSQERALGAALVTVAIFKVIVVSSTTSNNGGGAD